MAQKITLSLNETNLKFAKKEAKRRNISVSKYVDEQIDLMKQIEEKFKHRKLNPWVKEFAGMIDTGKNEDPKEFISERWK